MNTDFYWVNEPQSWKQEGDSLVVTTDEKTDFWNQTWYGFKRFSGHFYGCNVVGNFTFQVRVKADFRALYDQAGIMLMSDEDHWFKAGVEFNDGAPTISSVLTLGYYATVTVIMDKFSKISLIIYIGIFGKVIFY